MAITEERIRKVLHGLLRCASEPESYEDCGDCPYRTENDFCIQRLAHDAYDVIIELDRIVNQMRDGERGDAT